VTSSLGIYREFLARKYYFDYTSMMVDAVGFLERSQTAFDLDTAEESLRDHVRDDVKYVIVDEYQDVNPIQERLVRKLCHFGANLCVVGDDDQTIYQWRGSEVSNIVTFGARYDGVRTIELADNFRSSKGIVELGRSVAERLDSSERLAKKMQHASHQVWERGDMLTLQFEDEGAEAEFIAQRIVDLHGMPFVDKPGSAPRECPGRTARCCSAASRTPTLSWPNSRAATSRSLSRDSPGSSTRLRSKPALAYFAT
jgi:DNA helicase-2/ATP-dependent DNA helicase PcrA